MQKDTTDGYKSSPYFCAAFDDAFSPITDFLDDLAKITQERQIVIILDEFDRLPYDLYIKGPWGDSFFLTLRSITSRQNIGFILIGGERIVHIMDSQGVHLNKWGMIPVDYFSRDTDWIDYQELIQRPVNNFLEFTEDSILALHELTAGESILHKINLPIYFPKRSRCKGLLYHPYGSGCSC